MAEETQKQGSESQKSKERAPSKVRSRTRMDNRPRNNMVAGGGGGGGNRAIHFLNQHPVGSILDAFI